MNAVHDSGDVASRIRSAQGRVQQASEQIGRMVKSLKPALPDDTDIETLPVPPRATVQEHRDLVRDWTQRQREVTQRLADSRNALERDQKDLERRVRDERVVAPDALEGARARRDDLWKLIKLQYVERTPIPPEEMQAYAAELEYLPSAFEGAVREVDTVADQRFDKAEEGWRVGRTGAQHGREENIHCTAGGTGSDTEERKGPIGSGLADFVGWRAD